MAVLKKTLNFERRGGGGEGGGGGEVTILNGSLYFPILNAILNVIKICTRTT